ncbi:MAG: S8 family serine peptidase [Limisphaerales bacterium]
MNDPATAASLLARGGKVIADYGSFQLLELDTPALLSMPDGAKVEDESDVIELNAVHLNTRDAAVQAQRKALAAFTGKQLHLVQFAGPIKPEWRAELEATGVQIVTYIPNNAYLVYGPADKLGGMQSWASKSSYVQWDGTYLDDYKLQPGAILKPEVTTTKDGIIETKPVPSRLFAIQLVASPDDNAVTLQLIESLKLEPIREEYEILNYFNIVVRLDQGSLAAIAARPEVVSIADYPEPRKFDERQDQIMAGNLTGNVPTGPGYLAWLASKGFSQSQFTTSGFVIDLSDSGIDNGTATPGHFGLYQFGDPTQASRVAYNRLLGTANSGSTLQGCDGHGTLNSHIMAGYNDQPTGLPHTDAAGFHYGLGVCPFVKVGSSVIFDPDTFTSPNFPNLQSMAYNDGARISGNSWGSSSAGAYNTTAQAYDALVRDAQPAGSTFATAGNQEMVIVFAAGNSGSGASSVGAPGTAKNVISVGAAENVNSHSTANGGVNAAGDDGCDIDDTGANSANDIIDFSGRGPCTDGRKKPDIMAPGTHITGGVAQNSPPPLVTSTGSAIACFAGDGVCALPGGGTSGSPDNFFPLGQQFFTTSSGTSHSTPAIAGAAALLRQYFLNNSLTAPSPAMTKAYLMNAARYMTGVGANDTLPSNNQGFGEVNLDTSFDGAARYLRDELTPEKFTAPGQTRTYAGVVADPSKPFRVTVAWTDAPGSTTGNAYNNNLDLTVTVGGNTYLGNVFSGANSTTGGTADAKDNVESVFVPAGVSGSFVVTVTAANINSDGVPNEAPTTDQDFALVIYNADIVPTPVISADSAVVAAEGCTPTNGVVDPDETVTVNFALRNVGTSNTTSVVATLLATNGVTLPSAPQNYGALIAGGSAATQSFTFTAAGDCGTSISPTLQLQDGAVNLGTVSLSLPLGVLATVYSENFDAVTAPALPASWTTFASGGEANWVTSTTQRDTVPNAAFAADAATAGVNELDSAPFIVPSASSKFSFRHNYTTESGYDGGVLEIKIGTGAYTDILTAGGSFVSGGYNATINAGTSVNPLAGRQGWSGSSGGFITTIVNLPASAAGQSIQMRWRLGSDVSVGAAGWYVDTISLSAPSCCGQVVPPIASFTGTPTIGGAPLAVVFTDTSFGLVTNRFWDFGNGVTTNSTNSSISATYAIAGTYTVKLIVSGPAGTNATTLANYITVTNSLVNIIPNGYTLVTESCTNGALDPDELVTVNLNLRNVGSLASSNLVAALQASGGLIYPSGPQTYGMVAAGGGIASRPFTFVLSGSCGGTNIATLQLQDGAANLGTVSFALPLGQFAPSFTQNFDGVVAPALPAGWTTATSGAQSLWVISAITPDTAPNAAFSAEATTAGVNELVTPVIALPSGPAILSFRNNYNLEANSSPTGAGYDGGVLEIKIGAGAFTDIITAGGSFASGGYNRTISTSFSNPLAGRQAWSSSSGGYTNTIVNLPASAAGQNIQLKWRCGTDSSSTATGWRIDTISLSTLTCCSGGYPTLSSPRLTNNQFSFLISGTAGSNYIIQATTNLSGNYWIPIQTNAAPFLFIESNKDLYLQRFYRGLVTP